MATCQEMGDSSTNGDAVPSKPAFNLTNVDKWILQQPDETFKKHDWEDLRGIIGEQSPVARLWPSHRPNIHGTD